MQFLKRLVVALACALTLGLACLLALLIQNPETEEHEHTWIIIFLVVLLLAGILIASCLYAIFKSQHYTEENEILNKQLDHEGTMYSRTSELYERTRRLNHDLKSYLLIILGYLENAEYEQARLHLVEILDRQLKMNLIHYESSGEINAVLNDKLSYAEQHAITLDMHISGEVPREDREFSGRLACCAGSLLMLRHRLKARNGDIVFPECREFLAYSSCWQVFLTE